MKQQALETMVGGFVLLIAIAFVFFAYARADVGQNAGGYRVSAQFSRVDGVAPGTDVRISGVKVGTVSHLGLDATSYMADISMVIENHVKLPRDTVAKIDSEGLLGGQYVALEPGGDEEMLKDGEKLAYTQSSPSLQSLLAQVIFSSGGEKKGDAPASGQSVGAPPVPQSAAQTPDM